MSHKSNQEKRVLGNQGSVFPLALGCMGMSGMYGHSDENESIATIHEAIESGISIIDTGDFYGVGHNEMLIGRAIKGSRDKVLLSVKFGAMRSPDGGFVGIDCRPAAIKNFLSYTLTRLGVDYIDIYRPARLDPNVPIEDTVGAIVDLIKAGYVRQVGLSEVGAETIRRAHAVHPISDLQIEYSLISRTPETKIFPVLKELGIAATIYGVLSRGLLSGTVPTDKKDFRSRLPRFSGPNLEKNQKLTNELNQIAKAKNATPSQLAIAWAMAKGNNLIPTLGCRKRTQLKEALGALSIKLTPEDLKQIESAVPASAVSGTRYDEHQMKALDSERG